MLVGGVALTFGLIRLSAPPLWVDEAFTARAMRLPFPEYIVDQYHWLYYVIMRPWGGLAGTSEWALRLPSVFASAVACMLLFELGRQIFDQWVGLVAGVLMATSPFFVKWSQQGRSYTFLVAVSLLATLLLLRGARVGTRRAWLAYGMAISAAIVLQPVAALVLVPPHAIFAYQHRLRITRDVMVAGIVGAAICLPWMFVVSRLASEFWLDRPSLFSAARSMFEVSGAGWLGVPLSVVGLVVLSRAGRSGAARWLGTWAFMPFALAWSASYLKPVYLDRYLISAAPAFALLTAVALVYIGGRTRVGLAVVVVVATAVGLAAWYSHDAGTNWRGENWEQAVAATRLRLAPHERIIVFPWWAHPAASYYGAPVAEASTADSVWMLSWSEDGHEIEPMALESLGLANHRRVEQISYGWRLTAQHWMRRPTG
jgi:mannosyltransferase